LINKKLKGALGAMYYFGLGCKKDMEAAYECLTNSAERGNVYSMALLCDYYYRNKFYIKAADLSKK
jgi:TPR repeat protein